MFGRLPQLALVLTLLSFSARGQTPRDPSAVQGGHLLIVNLREHALLFLDPKTKQVETSVPIGIAGHEITLSKDGTLAYIPIYSDAVLGDPGNDGHSIDVVNLADRKLVDSIELGRKVRPHSAVWGSNGLLYVTAENFNSVEVVDVSKRIVVGEIPTGKPQSHMLVLSPDGTRGYTSNVDSGTISVLDVPHRRLLTIIPVTKRIQRIAISPDGRWLFTSDWDQPRVAVIDTKTNAVSRWIEVGGIPFATRPTPDGRWLLVAENKGDGGHVDVVDLAQMKPVRSYDLVSQPFGFFIHDGLAYMTCIVSGRVEILNLNTWRMGSPISLTPGVDGMAWSAR